MAYRAIRQIAAAHVVFRRQRLRRGRVFGAVPGGVEDFVLRAQVRRQAIRLLGERAGKRSFEFLSQTAQSTDGNTEVMLFALRISGMLSTSPWQLAQPTPFAMWMAWLKYT